MRQMLTPAILLAGSILAMSAAQADDCTSIVKNIEQQRASVAAAENALEALRVDHGYVYATPGAFLDKLEDARYELQIHALAVRRDRRAIENVLAAIDNVRPELEQELHSYIKTLRVYEAVAQGNLTRLLRDSAEVAKLANELAVSERKVELQRQKLEASVTRAIQAGCDYAR